MNEEINTISEEQVLHNKLSFEINQELIHLMKRIVELQQENARLKENNMSMQEEMARTWEKADLYKEVIEEVKRVLRCNNIEVLKYYDEPSETGSYEIVTVDLLQILDKSKGEMNNE